MDIYRKNFTIRYSETGIDGKLRPINIFHFFQDTASEHAYEMAVSGLHLRPLKRAWVVMRYQVDIIKYPKWNETITLSTWRQPHKNLYELRAFDICDNAGQTLISGKTAWVMIDTERKKPVRLDRNMPAHLLTDNTPVENDFLEIPPVVAEEHETLFRTRRADLDFNAHVNNAIFIAWALETGPEEVILHQLPCRIAVNYQADVQYGAIIRVAAQQVEKEPFPVLAHRISRHDDDRELTQLLIAWKSFSEPD